MKEYFWKELLYLFIHDEDVGVLKKNGEAVFFDKKYFEMSFDGPLTGKTFKGTTEEIFFGDIEKIYSVRNMMRYLLKKRTKEIEGDKVA